MQRKLLYLSCLSLALLYFSSCDEDDVKEIVEEEIGTLKMGYQEIPFSEESGISDQIPSSLVCSIQDENNNVVYANKQFNLSNTGSEWFTDEISLLKGEYLLTAFTVLNENDSVIYVAPISGSEFSSKVTSPLPIDFTIINNKETLLQPEVLSLDTLSTAEDYGYASFGFEIIETISVPIVAYIRNESNGENELTAFELTVESGDYLILKQELGASTTYIDLKVDNTEYVFICKKEGYQDITFEYQISEIKEIFSTNKVIKVHFK